jgi:hypothetical protein
MKGDFTRDSFDRTNHFRRVLMQQGRVQLDADFNEQAAILLHYLQTLAADLGGPYWGPADHLGFEISSEIDNTGKVTDGGNFKISDGRYYVDGILCEIDEDTKFGDQMGFTEDDLPESGRTYYVYLDVWERHVTHIQEEHVRETALGTGGPDTCTRAQVVWQVKLTDIVEEQDRLAQEESALKARLETEQNEKIKMQLEERLTAISNAASMKPECDGLSLWLKTRPRLSRVALTASLQTEGEDHNACSVPPESRYRGAENQLYRIEVHRSGTAWDGTEIDGKPAGNVMDAATFKWSRDNGSIVYPILQQSGSVVTLQSLGRDQYTGLDKGDWVEIMDDGIELHGEPGILAQVEEIVDPIEMTVRLKLPDDVDPNANPDFRWPSYDAESQNHPLLRRWDHGARNDLTMSEGAILFSEGQDVAIERGIQVQFQLEAGGEFRTGDYWLVPARVATGKIEWPSQVGPDGKIARDSQGDEIPQALPPHGIEHHHAPLGVMVNQEVTQKCRCTLERVPDNATNPEISTLKLVCTDPILQGVSATPGSRKGSRAQRAVKKTG